MSVEDQQRTAAAFPRVASRELGYNTSQVDQFLSRAQAYYAARDANLKAMSSRDIRTAVFDAARGGYQAQAVDAVLDRLEDAFAQRERDILVGRKGEEAWLLQLGKTSATLRARLHRPDGERFRRPRRNLARSYHVDDVDALCRKLLGYFEQDKALSVDVVRRAVFRPAKGRDGYEESQVDAFLDRVIELMAGID
ncbi:MAG: DivIVA domain repeat protein [Micrococcaceae bacterium]|nr:DivIVA domain repeat protein [Micrococcaceae bacterium]